MLLGGNFEAPATIKATRRNGPDGKPEEHLFFESAPPPPDLHKPVGDKPAPAKDPGKQAASST